MITRWSPYLRGMLFYAGLIPFAMIVAALRPVRYLLRNKRFQESDILPRLASSIGWRWANLVFPGIITLTPYSGYYYRVAGIACPRRVASGSDFDVAVILRNLGSCTWEGSGGVNPVRLGTWDPETHQSVLYSESWVLRNRPCGLRRDVPPGEAGEFSFTCRAPGKPGRYETEFAPVADGLTWFPGERIRVRVKVTSS